MDEKLTPNDIEEIIKNAGLADVMQVFNSAIEIDIYGTAPNGHYWDGYEALARLILYVSTHGHHPCIS